MRELRKVFNPVSGMKSEKDIEKGYRKIVSAYEVLHAKSQQMREEAEKTILYERMLDFARTPIFPPKPITAEDLRNEYWKMVLTKCRQEGEQSRVENLPERWLYIKMENCSYHTETRSSILKRRRLCRTW